MPDFHDLVDDQNPLSFYIAYRLWDNVGYFCASILPDIERNLRGAKRRKRPPGIYLHLDIGLVHNARWSQKKLPESKPESLPVRLIFHRLSQRLLPL
jgi:hypothetical protein